MNGKLGSLDAPVYFVNHRDPAHPPGYLMLAPYSNFATPAGYSREVADDLPSVDRLQRRLAEQTMREFEAERERDESLIIPRLEAIRDRLVARMTSAACSPYERDFIREYLALRIEKRDKYHSRFACDTAYLWLRENMLPKGRRANEESFNADRHEVKS